MHTGDIILIKKVYKVGPIIWKSAWHHCAIIIVKNNFIYVLENINKQTLVHEYIEFCRMHKHDFVILRHLYRPENFEINTDLLLECLENAIEDTYLFTTNNTIFYPAAVIGFIYNHLKWLDHKTDWTLLKCKDFAPDNSLNLCDVRLGEGVVISKIQNS